MILYNEIDPVKSEALRQLIKLDVIPDGRVDERSITEFTPSDLEGVTTFHAFAGIGIWAYAMRLAGIPDNAPVWTGSCPCQPYSKAGLKLAKQDERHLWPAWFTLISHVRPRTVYGEQVSAEESIGSIQRRPSRRITDPSGWAWIDHVQFDLEAASYAVGHRSFPAASLGAPHSRGRLYFVADTGEARLERLIQRWDDENQWIAGTGSVATPGTSGPIGGFWADSDRVLGTDGRYRFVKPGTQPMVNGASRGIRSGFNQGQPDCELTQEARVIRCQAYGDGIVAQQAALFMRASERAMGQL